MHSKGRTAQRKSDSYIEVRMLGIISLVIVMLALILPSLLRALDANNDNLDDIWESQYGISTNTYAFTNLVGWWQLNGTNNTDPALDRSGHGIHGTLSGFPSVPYGPGLYSNALYFTTNGAVNFPTTNSVLSATNQFTFSAWFQSTNNVSQPATIATWSDASTNGWSVGTDTNGVANVTFFNASTQQVVKGSTGAMNLYDGTWHQVAATYTTNQVATVYVDGVGEATNTITGWTAGAVSSFTFGVPNTNVVNNPYVLDEARLYNRALGAGEVPQIPPTYSDLNGTGLTVFDDYLEGLDPFSSTSIVTSGFAASGLTAYYGSSTPTLAKASGDLQTVAVSTFASNALVVHVTNGSGTALVGAPVTFSIPMYSDGGLSLTSGGTTTTSLSLTTDGSGNATVYYKSGPEGMQTNTILATAVSQTGSTSATFTENCGVLSGLALWLKADAGVTQSSGNVSAWADQSPNGNNTAQTSSGHRPTLVTNALNGMPVIHFNSSGSQYISAADSSSLDVGSYTILMAVNPGSSSDYQDILSKPYIQSSWNNPYASYLMYMSPLGASYFSGASSSSVLNQVSGPSTIASQGPLLITGVYGSSSLKYYARGYLQNSISVSSGSLAYSGSGSSLVLGGQSVGTPAQYYNGDIAEVLIYNRVLSSTEQQQAEVYLADKYGLYHPYATWPSAYSSDVQTLITAHQWTKAQADAYVAFLATIPVPGSGLALWLKADTGVTSSSGKVSQWADQSPNGNNAVQSSGTNQPTLVSSAINGKPALSFDGSSSYMSIPDNSSLRSSNITIIAVSTLSSAGDYAQIVSKPYSSSSVWSAPYQSYGLWYAPTAQPYGVSAISERKLMSAVR